MKNNNKCNNNKKGNDRRKNIKNKFLKTLGEGHSVSYAAKLAGINRSTAYRWKWGDEGFAAAWENAYEQGTDVFEERLLEAANNLNVTAILAALHARRPELYRHPAKMEVTGIVKHAHHDMSRFTDEELNRLLDIAKQYSEGKGQETPSEL